MSRPASILTTAVAVLLLAVATVNATVFTVDIVPTSSTTVGPGGSVDYQLVGELSGGSLGLALWSVDLHSNYAIPGGLPRLLPPPEMYSFVRPFGITNPPGPADDDPANPSGYGGTPNGDDWLWQIGGGQNTIGNTGPTPYPIGDVVLGVGLTPVVLAFGTAHLPTDPGDYQLELSTLFGNVITGEGVGDPPVFPVEAFEPAFGVSVLDITVIPEPASVLLLALGAALINPHPRRARCFRR